MSKVTVSSVQIEHLRETLGIGTSRPRLSWRIETAIANWQQAGYEVACCDGVGQLRKSTGRMESDQSTLVDWPFASLRSREKVSVQVRVWGTDGSASEWSVPVLVEAGLLSADDWTARFVTPAWEEDTSKLNPSPYLRQAFELRPSIKSARSIHHRFGRLRSAA